MAHKRGVFIVAVLLTWCGAHIFCLKDSIENITGRSDFLLADNFLTRIAFGSCMNGLFTGAGWHKQPQVVWKQIMKHQPDLWMWLGDAAYGDTRILPLLWKPSPLPLMAKYFKRMKYHPDYQDFLRSGVKVVGIWDDHDYGMNDGGMHFKNRLQTQNIYLDFIDEPQDSLRRRREGLYVSYTFGHGDKAVKVIMLDVRSFAVNGKHCDLLGREQWKWLKEQLTDPTPVAFTIITSGIQILSNSALMQNWDDCPDSYDRLIWLTQQREKVIYLSGDVHFGEVSCLNSSSSGFPIYEMTSSGLYLACTIPYVSMEFCSWLIKNIAGNDFRIKGPVVERNFGLVEINWDSFPVQVKLQVFGENNDVATEVTLNLDHIEKQLNPESCLHFSSWKPDLANIYLFWTLFGLAMLAIFAVSVSFLLLICKCFLVVLRVLFGLLPFWNNQNSKYKEKIS